ncbi:MAG TPA: hypothetical protein VJ781_03235 [Pyrinomonadaceae bacterium]|nr:hypothetical protein [Pyrinomonadaceae bacterium]
MMKLASRVILVAVAISVFCLTAFSQIDGSRKSDKDPRNEAPTVGTGGQPGGATGLFVTLDGKTLRKGEHTLSTAYHNYDRDPGNMDFTEWVASFQIALSNNFEIFYNTDIWRGVKVNSLRNISGTYLPDAGFGFPAIVLAPSGPFTPQPFAGAAVFRPAGTQPFVAFPFGGGDAGNFGVLGFSTGPLFGFSTGTNASLGFPIAGPTGGSFFPGVGSVSGGILPGIVLSTTTVAGLPAGAPTVFTVDPSYNPEAPFINKRYGTSWLNTHVVGFKWRFNSNESPVGVGVRGAWRYFHDRGIDRFAELQDGASPGGTGWGDFLGMLFLDARIHRNVNISANVGYNFNSDVKFNVDNDATDFSAVLLNRPDEFILNAGIDFPVNQYFQIIAETNWTKYVRSRTPNAFENDPWEVVGGFRVFPARWWGFGFAYRRHMNQQDASSMEETIFDGTATVVCNPLTTACPVGTVSNDFVGVPPGFLVSENPHGYIAQFFIGRRNPRLTEVENRFANVTDLVLDRTTITLPCPPGSAPRAGVTCPDNNTIVIRTVAVDPENDVLTYNYTVSGGRIVGTGANVSWDLTGVTPGTYTIVSAVDDGCGLCGQTQTRTVTVVNCDCVPVVTCVCPTLSVTGPAGVTSPGDTMTFTATAVGGPAVTYNWTVSAGTIESGQGTPSIVVRTSVADAGTNITATVTIEGTDPACNCDRTRSESGPVATILQAILIDEFGNLPADDIRGRLDNFFQELSNNPNNQGYIINYGTPAQIAARERLITNHINFRNFDRSRITLVRGGDTGEGPKTRLYRIPPGAANPTP